MVMCQLPVRPGEDLVMRVAVTVPKHVRVMALWFGISTRTRGSGPPDGGQMAKHLARHRLVCLGRVLRPAPAR